MRLYKPVSLIGVEGTNKYLWSNILIGNKNYFNYNASLSNYLMYLCYQQYFSKLLMTTVALKSLNSRDVVPKSLIYYVVHSVKTMNWKRFYIIHSNEIIESLFMCLWLKNIKLFIIWIRNYFERFNLKKHRKLFLILNFLLGKLVWKHKLKLQLKGLRLTLRGKFSKAGSVRKTRKYIKRGKCSYTSKNIALTSNLVVIRTITGVFSIKLEVFF